MGTGTGTEARTGTRPGMATGTGMRTGTGRGTGMRMGSGSITGSRTGTGTSTETGTGTGSGTVPGIGTQPPTAPLPCGCRDTRGYHGDTCAHRDTATGARGHVQPRTHRHPHPRTPPPRHTRGHTPTHPSTSNSSCPPLPTRHPSTVPILAGVRQSRRCHRPHPALATCARHMCRQRGFAGRISHRPGPRR